ncbi:MAG: hypothetical protein ISS25_04945 [Nanoarchaeota archaeon]|nr:hypothetical protein [DPANN group archaeon]MBL7117147.1 hypothetical protein [Nanoarchaeota archaeon]
MTYVTSLYTAIISLAFPIQERLFGQEIQNSTYQEIVDNRFITDLVEKIEASLKDPLINTRAVVGYHPFVGRVDLFYFQQTSNADTLEDFLEGGYYLQTNFNIEGSDLAKKYNATHITILDGGLKMPDGRPNAVFVVNRYVGSDSLGLIDIPYGLDSQLTKWIDDLYSDVLKTAKFEFDRE